MKGKVKFFDRNKGFGFIKAEGSGDHFVGRDDLPEGLVLNEGDEVEFDSEQGPKGKKAVNVKKVEENSEEEQKEAA